MRSLKNGSRIVASLLLTILSGCAAKPEFEPFEPLARSIPEEPSFAKPVKAADIREGESCFVAYDRKSRGLKQSNSIIVRYNEWLADVRSEFARESK